MRNKLTLRVGALSCAAALLLAGCAAGPENNGSEPSEDITHSAAPTTDNAPAEHHESTPEASGQAENSEQADSGDATVTREADGTVKLADISVKVPEEWEETPAGGLSEVWRVGVDDNPNDPKVRLRVAPIFGDSPHPNVAEAEMFGMAEMGGLYGDGFKATERRQEELKGAKKGFVTDFSYATPDGGKMVGRWWFFQNPTTNHVTAVEIVGEEDVLTDELLQQIDQSLELQP